MGTRQVFIETGGWGPDRCLLRQVVGTRQVFIETGGWGPDRCLLRQVGGDQTGVY